VTATTQSPLCSFNCDSATLCALMIPSLQDTHCPCLLTHDSMFMVLYLLYISALMHPHEVKLRYLVQVLHFVSLHTISVFLFQELKIGITDTNNVFNLWPS